MDYTEESGQIKNIKKGCIIQLQILQEEILISLHQYHYMRVTNRHNTTKYILLCEACCDRPLRAGQQRGGRKKHTQECKQSSQELLKGDGRPGGTQAGWVGVVEDGA